MVTDPEAHVLGLLVPAGQQIEMSVLKPSVSGQHCGSEEHSSGDLGIAVDRALVSVEGANVLVNVSVYALHRPGRVCIKVQGDAAALY